MQRSAIGEAVERELGERRGKAPARELLKSKETAQIAAEKAGLGSKNTYRRVKKVTKQAEPELVDAMDEGRGRGNPQNSAGCCLPLKRSRAGPFPRPFGISITKKPPEGGRAVHCDTGPCWAFNVPRHQLLRTLISCQKIPYTTHRLVFRQPSSLS